MLITIIICFIWYASRDSHLRIYSCFESLLMNKIRLQCNFHVLFLFRITIVGVNIPIAIPKSLSINFTGLSMHNSALQFSFSLQNLYTTTRNQCRRLILSFFVYVGYALKLKYVYIWRKKRKLSCNLIGFFDINTLMMH